MADSKRLVRLGEVAVRSVVVHVALAAGVDALGTGVAEPLSDRVEVRGHFDLHFVHTSTLTGAMIRAVDAPDPPRR